MARARIPRLLVCKTPGCLHEWRAREPSVCPKCKGVEVASKCGARTKKGPCRSPSAHGASRCKTHGAKKQARHAVASLGRAALYSNRTYADAVLRAASDPQLRDMTHDHAALRELLDVEVGKASAGEGGGSAWKRLNRIIGALDRDHEDNPAAIPGHVAALKILVAEELLRSSALVNVDMLLHRRTEMLKAEATISQQARAFLSIIDVQVMIVSLVAAVREVATEEVAAVIGRRIALMAPGVNTMASLEVQSGN